MINHVSIKWENVPPTLDKNDVATRLFRTQEQRGILLEKMLVILEREQTAGSAENNEAYLKSLSELKEVTQYQLDAVEYDLCVLEVVDAVTEITGSYTNLKEK